MAKEVNIHLQVIAWQLSGTGIRKRVVPYRQVKQFIKWSGTERHKESVETASLKKLKSCKSI